MDSLLDNKTFTITLNILNKYKDPLTMYDIQKSMNQQYSTVFMHTKYLLNKNLIKEIGRNPTSKNSLTLKILYQITDRGLTLLELMGVNNG